MGRCASFKKWFCSCFSLGRGEPSILVLYYVALPSAFHVALKDCSHVGIGRLDVKNG